MQDVTAVLIRIVLASAFTIAAGAKLASLDQFKLSLNPILTRLSPIRERWLIAAVLIGEVGLAIWLLSGWNSFAALGLAAGSLIVLTVVQFYMDRTHSRSQGCGCFGNLVPNRWNTSAIAQKRNASLILLGLAGLIVDRGSDVEVGIWTVPLVGSAVGAAWYAEKWRSRSSAGYGLSHLPYVSSSNHAEFIVSPDKVNTLVFIGMDSLGIWQEVCNVQTAESEMFACNGRMWFQWSDQGR